MYGYQGDVLNLNIQLMKKEFEGTNTKLYYYLVK